MSSTSEHFTAQLPTKRVAADRLIFDADGRFMLVEPTYKSTWDVPGGVCEVDESPRSAAQREVVEEVGLRIDPAKCWLSTGSHVAIGWMWKLPLRDR